MLGEAEQDEVVPPLHLGAGDGILVGVGERVGGAEGERDEPPELRHHVVGEPAHGEERAGLAALGAGDVLGVPLGCVAETLEKGATDCTAAAPDTAESPLKPYAATCGYCRRSAAP